MSSFFLFSDLTSISNNRYDWDSVSKILPFQIEMATSFNKTESGQSHEKISHHTCFSVQSFAMKKLFSFSAIYQISIAAVLFLAIGILGTFWLINEYKHHVKALESLQDDYIADRKAEAKMLINNLVDNIEYQKNGVEMQLEENLRYYAEIGWSITNTIYQNSKNRLSENEIKQLVIACLMPMRFFEGRGYFWIHNKDYKLVAHPFRPDSVGKDDAELTDSNGLALTRTIVEVAATNPQGGFISYHWNKPDVNEKHHKEKGLKKIAYVKLFKPFNWVIGVGEYVTDVEKQVQKEIIARIGSLRHGEKGYVFNHSRDGICLNHVKEANIGKNRWEYIDTQGVKVVQELDRTGRQPGGGFLEYIGSVNPETGRPARKISYAQSIDGWGWVLGSGIYLTDIEKKIEEYRKELVLELQKKIITTVFLLFGVMTFGFFIGRQLFHNLLKELNLFVEESQNEKTEPIDLEKFRIEELRTIAKRSNSLLEEKEQVQADLNSAKRMESIGLMAGGVAHDLNNILSGIVGYPEVLLHKLPEDSELRKPLGAILESGKRASTVVADLLTIARGAASTKEVHNLNSLVQEHMNSPECQALKKIYPTINCSVQLEADAPYFSCSPVHVKKCLVNLVMNGTEAVNHSGTIIVSTSNHHVSDKNNNAADLEKGAYVVLSVKDDGHGISRQDMEHIFEPFYTRKQMGRSGTGLGLTVVWNTMEDHGGKVLVDSSEKGTCFKLYFPQGTMIDMIQTETAEDQKYTGNNELILIVDDEPQILDIAGMMLEAMGYKTVFACSGEMAVEYLKKNAVDLIVLDMLMEPGMNGRQTYEKILKIHPDPKVIITSGFSESNEVKIALELGAGMFIKKPYTMGQLGKAVKNTLNRL